MSFIPANQIHIDKHLTNVALNFRTPRDFFCNMIAPVVNVQKQSDLYKVYDQGDLWRIEDTQRAPGTEANEIDINISSDSYFAKNFAMKAKLTIEDMANRDAAFVRDQTTGMVLTLRDKLMLDCDNRVGALVSNTSNVGSAVNVASAWADSTGCPDANADPFCDLNERIDSVHFGTGYRPNKMLIGVTAWKNLKRHPLIIDKTQKTGVTGGAANASILQIQELFGFDKVLLASTFKDNAEEGQAKAIVPIFDDQILIYYAPPTPSLELPSYMYSFRWTGGGLQNMNVRRLAFDDKTQTSAIEIGYYQDEKIVSAPLAALLSFTGSSQ